jgi:hypothetical protein
LSCLLFVAELLGLKQTLVSRWSVAATVVCVCTYVRLWYPRSFCQSDVICTTAHQEWWELGGFIFLFRQLVGLLRQPWRKKFNLTGEIK